MISLAIDASTYRGTVAVLRDGAVASTAEAEMRGVHSERLMPAVVSALVSAGIKDVAIDRVICGAGPGSFTSLRIAASLAKGIALGRQVPLYGVSSLGLILAASATPPGQYVVTLDALRGEWYAAGFERSRNGAVNEIRPAVLVAKDDIGRFAESMNARILGAATDGAAPHASGCLAMMESLERDGPIDLGRWEPAYGRLAEAQVKWEAAHGRALDA